MIKISNIQKTDRLQPRQSINYLIVDNYTETMKSGGQFPPVEIVFDGENHWLWDGFHRVEAAIQAGLGSIDANITNGTLQDAEWLCLSANKNHGLHRTNEDKRRAVMLAFEHPNSKEMSDRLIAEHCGVSQPFVSNLRKELGDNRYHVKGKDGKVYKVKQSPTEKIIPEARELIAGTWIADSQKDLKDLSSIKPTLQIEIVNLVLDGTSHTVKQARKEHKRLRKLQSRQKITIPVNSNVWHGDFREVGEKIPDNSVDIVFTDPPYNEDAIQLYRDLGIFAKRVLKPGGLCLAYSGQIFLPQSIEALSQNLSYIWCCAIRHSSGYTRIFKVNSRNMWKPILFYAKEPYETWWKTIDDMIDGKMEKESHEWQQAYNEAEYYLSKLCPPNGLVLDPFCGSGTTLVATKSLGLNYIGIEDDIEDVQKAIERLNDQTKN